MRPALAFAAAQLSRLAGWLGTLVVDEVERFCRGEPLQHRVLPDLLGRLA